MKRSRALPPAWVLVSLLGPFAGAQEESSPPLKACLGCHDSDDVMEFADGAPVSIQVDKVAYLAGAHGQLSCTECHGGLDLFDHMDEERPSRAEYRRQRAGQCEECHLGDGSRDHPGAPAVHQTLHPLFAAGTPLCTDCHAAHATSTGAAARRDRSLSCARCHEERFAAFAASAHGAGLRAVPDPNVPVCTDCHGGHQEPGTAGVARQVRLGQPCMGCHGDQELMGRYGLSANVVSTYLSDFHGVSVAFYDREQADLKESPLVCADCHGVHDVAPVAGAGALMKDQLLDVCQRCHEQATASFPDAWLSHYEPSLEKATLVYLVKVGYWILIPFVIVGLSLQILVDLVFLPRRRRQERARREARGDRDEAQGPGPGAPAGVPASFVRFTVHQRVEHLLVMVLFVVLLLTGLPQKFHDSAWAIRVIGWLGGIDLVRMLHRATGLVFSAQVVLHLALAGISVLRGRAALNIVPRRKDFTDAIQNLRYYLGRGRRHPEFDRFDYRQKFEYWGMVLGSGIMIGSGLVLYFPMLAAAFLPGQFIPAAKAAHTYEAMMALLTIIVWHMYGAHFNAECFPMDKSIFTGRISGERLRREHPLEFRRLVQEPAAPAGPPAPGGRSGLGIAGDEEIRPPRRRPEPRHVPIDPACAVPAADPPDRERPAGTGAPPGPGRTPAL